MKIPFDRLLTGRPVVIPIPRNDCESAGRGWARGEGHRTSNFSTTNGHVSV